MANLKLVDAFTDFVEESTLPYRQMMTYYNCALMEVETKFKVLNEQFSLFYDRNPIESIHTRIKSQSSILKKLQKKNLALTIPNIENNLFDIAGVRVVCSFTEDICSLADSFLSQDDVRLIEKKDYIQNPKENGYRSLHLIIEIPIFLSDEKKWVKVEVQFRTIAMDFWASLEHKIRYKFEGKAPQHINEELKACSDIVNMLDAKMLSLNEEVQALPKVGVEEQHEENVRMQKMWEENKIVDKLQKK